MSEISVLYFAALRDQVGLTEERLVLPADQSVVADVLNLLVARHPSLSLEAVRVALNEEFTDARATISHGDVLALIPPVSGG